MPSFAAPDAAVGVGEVFERSLSFALLTTLSIASIRPWHLALGGHVIYVVSWVGRLTVKGSKSDDIRGRDL